jgi:LysM repeat protein
MERKDYPFDANGTYMTSWAALGSPAASSSDYDSWKSSHGGRASKSKSGVKKYTAAKKKGSSSSSKKGGSSSKSKGGSGYVVKSGDTLSAIARRNNTTVAKLKAANGLSSDLIRAGKPLKIPK